MTTKIRLMAAVPCKRFDFSPACTDGRGGWAFSQFGADRYVADPEHHAIKLGLAIWVTPAIPDDFIESTTLAAHLGSVLLGTDTLDWKQPNSGGVQHAAGSVYQWIQDVAAPIQANGLIGVTIDVKLHSQPAALIVDGRAYIHVTFRDTNSNLVDAAEYDASLNDSERSWNW